MLTKNTSTILPGQSKRNQLSGLRSKFQRIWSSLLRHFMAHNVQPYERLLRYMNERGDIWIASQGEYIFWWRARENATLKIEIINGSCQVHTSLENAVVENCPGQFINSSVVECPETDFSGEVWITISSKLEQKEMLLSLLKREGILNLRVADEGDFILTQEDLGPLLAEIEAKFNQKELLYEADIAIIRQVVQDKLAKHNLPLLRIWYHPKVNGVIPKAVFSPRYDVDRAIANLAKIRALENKYNANSTLYIRTFCPFYSDDDIKALAAQPWCSEIAVHGEFLTNARRYGDEFKAARAEKTHLEKLIKRPILGSGMHGGELTYNRSENTIEAIREVGFLYDTTMSSYYYFPYKKYVDDQLKEPYTLRHSLSDVRIPANRNYGNVFYEQAIAMMDKIYAQNGVFVLMLHPVYFGFFSYLSRPKNWLPFLKFSLRYFKQLL